MESDKLTQAVKLVKAGNKQAALPLLKEVVQADPRNEMAWLWLYASVETTFQKKYCLQKALEINPHNQDARNALNKLSGQQPRSEKQKPSTGQKTIKPSKPQTNGVASLFMRLSDFFGKQKTPGKIAIGCVGFLILCCLCSVPISLMNPANTSVQIERPLPTQFSDASALYILEIRSRYADYYKHLLQVTQYQLELSNDNYLIFDNSWKQKMGYALGQLNNSAQAMAETQPTSEFKGFHQNIDNLAIETELMVFAYAEGIDKFDVELLEKAAVHAGNMEYYINLVAIELGKLENQP